MQLTGKMIKGLMRKHGVTMRQLKARHQINLKRIREVRASGVTGLLAEEWMFLITGAWPTKSPQ